MNNNKIQEGSIDVRNEVVKVMSIVKEIIRGLYSKKYVKGGVINGDKVVTEDEFKKVLEYINHEIKHRLYDSGVISCDILFVTWLKDGEASGSYYIGYDAIAVDGYKYLTEFDEVWGVYRYRNFSKIRFDDMSRTMEHELVHHEQYRRSKGKFFKNKKDVSISDEEMVELKKKKNKVAPDMSDEVYIKRIKYYNRVSELDTFANNAADKYIQYKVKEMRNIINFRTKHENEEVRNYSGEEVRKYVLSGILRSNEGRFGMKLDIQRKLIELSSNYKFLTVKNKKKYWKYLFKALLVNRFEPMIFVK